MQNQAAHQWPALKVTERWNEGIHVIFRYVMLLSQMHASPWHCGTDNGIDQELGLFLKVIFFSSKPSCYYL